MDHYVHVMVYYPKLKWTVMARTVSEALRLTNGQKYKWTAYELPPGTESTFHDLDKFQELRNTLPIITTSKQWKKNNKPRTETLIYR